MNEDYTEAERNTADTLGMGLNELRTILDTYMDQCRLVAIRRKEGKEKEAPNEFH